MFNFEKWYYSLTLSKKFILIIMLLFSIFSVLALVILYQYQKQQILSETRERVFSQLDDLNFAINFQYQRRIRELDLYQRAANLFYREFGGIEVSDSAFVEVEVTDEVSKQKHNIKLQKWLHNGQVMQGDTLTVQRLRKILGDVGTITISQKTEVGFVRASTVLKNADSTTAIYTAVPFESVLGKLFSKEERQFGTLNYRGFVVFYSTEPVYDKHGEFKGYINCSFRENFSEFREIANKKTYLKSGFFYVLDEFGIIKAHPNKDAIEKSINESPTGKTVFEEMKRYKRGEGSYIDQWGVKKYHYYTYFEPYRIFISIAVPESELLDAPLRRLLSFLLIGVIIILLVVSFLIYKIAQQSISLPIEKIIEAIQQIATGKYLKMRQEEARSRETLQAFEAINHLSEGLQNAATFADEIGEGNFETEFQPLSKQDMLGQSLLKMRDALFEDAQQEVQRDWVNLGIANFSQIIRQHSQDSNELGFYVVSELVKYLKAAQGAFFVISDDKNVLEMKACYAFERRKFSNKTIIKGEGLLGQSWVEKSTIYLTEIPQNYAKITSGLGEANPSCLLIVPMITNEKILGIIEIASFSKFMPYQIEFVEKVAANTASTLSSVKNAERTQYLLEKAQQMTEEMRSQEEEMRQNLEELQATQEEIFRREKIENFV